MCVRVCEDEDGNDGEVEMGFGEEKFFERIEEIFLDWLSVVFVFVSWLGQLRDLLWLVYMWLQRSVKEGSVHCAE